MVTVRRARGDDADALSRFLSGLSSTTAQRRFNAPLPRVPDALVRALLGDGETVLAWVAVTADRDGERLVGHAMLAEAAGGRLEFAVVVADGWQRTGVGRDLAEHARGWLCTGRHPDPAPAPRTAPVVELVVHPANRPAMGWAVRAVSAARRCASRAEVRLELVALA